jgi:hypothetical protein
MVPKSNNQILKQHNNGIMKKFSDGISKNGVIAVGFLCLFLSTIALTVNWRNVSAFAQDLSDNFSNAKQGGETQSPNPANSNHNDGTFTIGVCDTAGPIEIESSGGTTTPTAYATLKAAFDAINAGTHTGTINVEVCGNTAETAVAEIFASGTGSSSYTSVTVRPVGGARIIEGSIVGAIVKLTGADNVTIDGRQSGTGTARDLTVRNNSTAAATAAIWLASVAAGNGASNNVIRNLEIAAGQTANTGTNTTIGIYMGGTTISLTSTDGNDNDNNQFIFNRVTRARYGIATRGVTTNNNIAPIITDNIIGPTSFGADEIGKAGIFVQADTGAVISRNTVQFVGGDLANTTAGADRCGICVGSENWSQTSSTTITSGDYTVTKNIIHDIVEERTFSAIGIGLGTTRSGSATNNLVANNFIYNVRSNGTAGDQVVGIAFSGGHTDSIVFNSISLTGDMDPTGATSSSIYGNAIRVSTANGTNNVNLTLMNNSIYMDVNSNTATNLYYAITLPSAAYVFGTGGLNYNNYYVNQANLQMRTGGLGTTSGNNPGASFQTLANWQTALTTPQDPNSIQTDPLYFSTTSDLHLQPTSPNVNAGLTIAGITDDIDAQVRPNGASSDIGADEIVPGTLQFSSATYSVGEGGGTVTLTVNRTGGSDGAVSADYSLGGGTATGGAACGGTTDYVNTGGTVSFANGETSKTFNVTICEDAVFEGNETFDATLSNPMGGATIGTPNPATVTITDNDTQPSLQFSSATYSVGEAGGMATITVTRTGATGNAVGVSYATSDGTATGGATCTTGVDYQNTSGMLSFASGDTSKTFDVPICNDTAVESNETVNLALSLATGGATIGTPGMAVLTINDDDMPATGNVVVNPGNIAYMTLGDAVAAINAGTHTGAITVSINANTTETGPVVLNSSGAGSASYTSIVIGPTIDNAMVSGPTPQGRGLLELNGADNVTIDGDNPNTGGTNRNLTFQNTAANTTTFTSVIRIALATTIVNSADNNIIRNLNIVGSSTGRNISTATSTTASENTTFGIFAGPGASTVDPTTPPAAVTSVLTGVAAGATANNLMISNNSVITAARAISMNGSATSVFPGLQITDNRIGNQTAGDPNQVTSIGITAQGSTDAMIRGNTVWVEGYIASSTATHGINVGVNSINVTGATIEKNRVNRVKNNNGGTWSAFGINLGGGSSHIVRNNFVSGVINDQTAGTGGFGTTFGAYGIRIVSGTGHKIYHNSVHLYGMLPGVVSTDLTAAFLMSATTQTGVDVRNNIFSNQITGGNPTGTRHVAIYLPSAGTSAMNLTLNNNGYYQGTDALSRMAKVGATFGTLEFIADNFDPTSTTPATNFRAYTSTLSAAGTNDNASFATTAAPPFTSNTDLHIPAGTATRLESGGAAVGVTDDIDMDMRNATTPDIGADEFAGNPPPPNDIAATSILTPVPNSIVTNGTSVTPQARFFNVGSATQTNVGVQFTITGPGGYNYTNMQTIATINPNQPVNVTFAAAPAFTTIGMYNMAAIILTADSNPANDQVMGNFEVRNPVAAGTHTVGAGGEYASLTNPGGIFADLNLVGAAGNIVINIVSDLTTETGAVPLNQLAGGFSVTIKPSGGVRTISGTAPANTGLINLNGADNVTIDGSLSGGTDRSLTITNNQTGLSTVVWIRSASSSNGSNNNTVKNCIINGAVGATATTTAGILSGSGVTLGNDAEAPNNNNTIQNNWIYRVQNSMYLRGGAGANIDMNWTVTGNEMGSTASTADKNIFRGMLIGNSQNFNVMNNLVHGVQSTTTTAASMSGIQIALVVNNGNVTNNTIHDIKNVSTTGTGANAVSFISTSTTSNVTVANNFIYDVAALGSATLASNGFGINVASGAGYKIYHNSVNLNTNQGSGTTAAMLVQAAVTTAGGLDIRNNIFANTQTAGATRYAFYSGAAATVYSMINYNNYFSTGSVGFLGSARATLADWQTATGQDMNSKAVDPLYVSATNLHLQAASPMVNMGTTIAGITTDIDGQRRDAIPDIGADEVATAPRSDFDGDGKADLGIFRLILAGNAQWLWRESSTGMVKSLDWGLQTDYPTPADFDGDGKIDVAVWRTGPPTQAAFYILNSSNGSVRTELFGQTGDIPIMVGDYDGDRKADPAVYRPGSQGVFYYRGSLNNPNGNITFVPWGTTDDKPAQGDYNGDGRIDFAVYRSGVWWILYNGTFTIETKAFGLGTDRLVQADYDGDGKTDLAVFRPSDTYWYILRSSDNTILYQQWGLSTDILVPTDYDGDGLIDIATYRNGTWYILQSSNQSLSVQLFGTGGDAPLPSVSLVP